MNLSKHTDIHHPQIRLVKGKLYCNDGDWVENCSALAEDFDGKLILIRFRDGAFQYQPYTA